MFNTGEELLLPNSSRKASVDRLIGQGGQGSVYQVTVVEEPRPLALKWYFPKTATPEQQMAIRNLVKRGPPSSRFLWPIELVELANYPGFGYLMPLRPAEYVSLASLLVGRIEARSAVRTTLCRELARSFLNLHSQGLCYRDISFANIFIEPTTGRPLVCDNDNVAIDDGSPSPVLGTRKFMAPEIVRVEAEPSRATDLWSLAVLLFYILLVGHPLLGRRELDFPSGDEEGEIELFGRSPLFVFHPGDDSNRPDTVHHAGMEVNWGSLPVEVRRLFTGAFTDGVTDPVNGRVGESVWQRAMARLEDSIFLCRRCGAESFFDPERPEAECWACGRRLQAPMRLVFPGGRWVALGDRTRLWDHHVAQIPTYGFESMVAEVAEHPTRRGVWGLRNVSSSPWRARQPDGREVTVDPGSSHGLVPGTVFDFGEVQATLDA